MALALGIFLLCPSAASSQTAQAEPPRPAEPVTTEAPRPAAVPPSDSAAPDRAGHSPATLHYLNRPIITLRATVLGRSPDERADAAVRVLDRLVDEVPGATVTTERVDDDIVLRIAGRSVIAVLPHDVDTLAGETVERKAADAAARLGTAFAEAVELRNPTRLLIAGLSALGGTLVYLIALWGLLRLHRYGVVRLSGGVDRRLGHLPAAAEIARTFRAAELLTGTSVLAAVVLALGFTDAWLTFVLRRFPFTRHWGDELRGKELAELGGAIRMAVEALPGLVTAIIIVLCARFAVKMVGLTFQLVEQGRLSIPGVYPETAVPTRRIVVAMIWLFCVILAYRYVPGSDSDAFKGISVFVGLMISLGSSGIMNQIMSGFTLTYSRALRLGDVVRVGDVEGSVIHLGTLATKIKTSHNEDVTIPNAVVVSTATTNYSRHAKDEGVYVPLVLSIGYDTPWRQVQALLQLAAARTPGVRTLPAPVARQTAMLDSCVQYTLLVCLEEPALREQVLDALHANIQDVFNEYGVKILVPSYKGDLATFTPVPKSQWFAAPASAAADLTTPASS
jgi:small-conductance mechanosensitive channel